MSYVNEGQDVKNQNISKRTNVRWHIVTILFIVTAINVGDRTTLAITGKDMSHALGINAAGLGWVFSAFSWAYCFAQLPGGWLLDKFGSKRVYLYSLFFWSLFTLLQGFVNIFNGFGALLSLSVLLFLVGLAEAPAMPGNSRFTAAWFPAKERATAAAIFNSAQYFATVIFAPIMGWITADLGWESVFIFMGVLGFIVTGIASKIIYNPLSHPKANAAEIDYIRAGGALVDMDKKSTTVNKSGPKLGYVKQLLTSRMLLGIYLGQYCISVMTFFFITWFPIYLAEEKGLNIKTVGLISAIPAICGFLGGLTGGVISDIIMKKTNKLSFSRKAPIVFGMLLSMSLVLCNYVDSIYLIVFFMALAFFGKGVGALGWAVMADTAPKEIAGLAGGLFNMCGSISGIISPVIIGYIVHVTGKFEWALVFVAAHAVVAIVSYVFLVGPIKRMELTPLPQQPR